MLRPSYLKEARAAFDQGNLSPPDLKHAEDRAVDQAIAMQEGAGVDVVSDGEMRRFLFMGPITETVEGIEFVEHDSAMPWSTPEGDIEWTSPAAVTSKLRKVRSMVTEGAQLRASAREAAAEGDRAQPARALWVLEPAPLDRRLQGRIRDVRRRRRGRALGDPGARRLGLRVHPGRCARAGHARRSAGARLGRRARLRGRTHAHRGHRPHQLHVQGISGVRLGIHLCRGNNAGMWMASGGYEFIAKALFERATAFDAFFLEYDSPRSGSFEPLAGAPEDKQVVLGLVSTKDPELETGEELLARIEDAARSSRASSSGCRPSAALPRSPPATRSPRPTRSRSCGWSPRRRARRGAERPQPNGLIGSLPSQASDVAYSRVKAASVAASISITST